MRTCAPPSTVLSPGRISYCAAFLTLGLGVVTSEDGKLEHPKCFLHIRFGVLTTQPSSMDPGRVNRHAYLAVNPCNTRVLLFSPWPSARVAAITPGRVYHHLMSVLHGALVPHQTRGDRFPLLWRGWSDSSLLLRLLNIPPSSAWTPSDASSYVLCMWEHDVDVVPSLPPLEEMTSRQWPSHGANCLHFVAMWRTPSRSM